MAVHNLGYRGWAGELAPAWSRFVVITVNGVRRAWTSKWLRRMMMFAWMPALYFAGIFFVFEQGISDERYRQTLIGFLQATPLAQDLQEVLRDGNAEDIVKLRHRFWAMLLNLFFQGPQAYVMVMMVGVIAPPLISQDVRSRAFLLYFSRPINRWEYILGKASTLWFYLTAISAAPGLALYVLGILLSPGVDVIAATWDLPFRILLASAFLMIPTASLALCFSSMTQESRVAGFAWFALWILGAVAAGFITAAQMAMQGIQPSPTGELPISIWSYLSLFNVMSLAQNWVFEFSSLQRSGPAILVLIAVTAVSMAILYRKVSAPMRA